MVSSSVTGENYETNLFRAHPRVVLLDRGLLALRAYQYGFLAFGAVALVGAWVGTQLGERKPKVALRPARASG